MLAHIREDQTKQTMTEHSRNVAALTARTLSECGLASLGEYVGLTHDIGKENEAFQRYLREVTDTTGHDAAQVEKAAPHSPVGAIWAYERYFTSPKVTRRRTAHIVALAILGHHSGLTDCIDLSEAHSPFFKAMNWKKAELHYDESVANYLSEVAAPAELDALFDKACEEVQAFCEKVPKDIRTFCVAMTARLVLGALTDADRWDTTCFEHGEDPLLPPPEPKWQTWLDNLEARMGRFPQDGDIAKIRAGISADCREAGKHTRAGVYRLTVPTGGGKTLSSLLFALEQACTTRAQTERLFYVAPFNTILDQNAQVIREALGEDELLLEHHADIVFDPDEKEEEQRHRVLTERWTSRIILTSMVQLLQSLFKGGNTNARRMPKLVNSILIFDEIQALPRKCTVLFECAARYLADCLGCTVLLCTATQPTLRCHRTEMGTSADLADLMDALPPLGEELLPQTAALFEQLRRVRFVDERAAPRTNAQAAEDVLAQLQAGQSVLMVVNTKAAAREVFKSVKAQAGGALCIHLTTDMCAAHRKQVIREMIAALDRKRRDPAAPCVCCVSTALIEAGVDISFPVVIRSAAGLPSILQAAGRCNRNGETDRGTVYIWKLAEERLSGLAEIRQAQQDSDGVLDRAAREGLCIDQPAMIDLYFRQMLHNDAKRAQEFFYPVERAQETYFLTSLLSGNQRLAASLEGVADDPLPHLSLRCSWRTAGRSFTVIDQDTEAVITPYGRGAEIIAELNRDCAYPEEKALLKEAQQYCVSLWPQRMRKLREEGALFPLGETGAWALQPNNYDSETGVTYEAGEMDFLGY